MPTEFTLPELGEGVENAEVSRILVHEGDTVDEGDNVLELATDKAIADLPIPHAGKIVQLHVSEGDTVEIGQPILSLEPASGAEEQQAQQKAPAEAEPAAETSPPDAAQQAAPQAQASHEEPAPPSPAPEPHERPTPATAERETTERAATERESNEQETAAAPRSETEDTDGRAETELTPSRRQEPTRADGQSSSLPAAERRAETVPPPAGPATRRLARKLGVDLRDVWSGQDRVRPEDVVEQYTSRQAGKAPAQELPDFSRFGPIKREPLGPIYKSGAENLTQAWQLVPHVTQNDLADITELESARKRFVEHAPADSPKLTITPIVIKAIVATLKEFPRFNASLDAAHHELIFKQYYHIGIAVDTEHGLLVPTIRDADQKTILQLAQEVNDLAERARARKLTLAEMEGATFTISNQGSIGGTSFTPLVVHPQVAILGLSRARWQAEVDAGNVVTRLMLPLSLSYDHRVINGADAARFVARLAQILTDPFTLLAAV